METNKYNIKTGTPVSRIIVVVLIEIDKFEEKDMMNQWLAGAGGAVTSNGYEVSFWCEENVWNYMVIWYNAVSILKKKKKSLSFM